MAHEVETMAYIHDVPWHGLGRRLSERAPLEVWLQEAGTDWQIRGAEVMYQTPIDDQA